MSEMTATGSLKWHAICHGLALTLIALAIVADDSVLMLIGGVIGLAGAVSFAWFVLGILRRVFVVP
jgi:hypothetical protein